MDLYTFSLVLGVAGILIMALQGMGGGHGDHGHGQDAGGHAHAGHAGHAGHGVSHDSSHAGAHGPSHDPSHAHSHFSDSFAGKFLWAFASPRTWFSILIGMGLSGRAMRPVFDGGPLLFVAALGIGIIFEWAMVRPLWNFAFKFGSKPALMLESAVEDEATAVTAFDGNGQGIVAIDLDGHVVQVLATLRADDRALGAAVRAGDRVRISDVDSARNRCTVAVL